MAAALGTTENLALLQPRNSHEIAFLPSLDLAAGIDQRIGSARLGTPSLWGWSAESPRRTQGPPQGLGWGLWRQRSVFIAMAATGAIGFVATGAWIWLFG